MFQVVEERTSFDRLLAYSISCPSAARPLAAQMREYGMEEQAEEMTEKVRKNNDDIYHYYFN